MQKDQYNLSVTHQDLLIIVAALHEAPYKVVAPLLLKLQQQITEQEITDSEH